MASKTDGQEEASPSDSPKGEETITQPALPSEETTIPESTQGQTSLEQTPGVSTGKRSVSQRSLSIETTSSSDKDTKKPPSKRGSKLPPDFATGKIEKPINSQSNEDIPPAKLPPSFSDRTTKSDVDDEASHTSHVTFGDQYTKTVTKEDLIKGQATQKTTERSDSTTTKSQYNPTQVAHKNALLSLQNTGSGTSTGSLQSGGERPSNQDLRSSYHHDKSKSRNEHGQENDDARMIHITQRNHPSGKGYVMTFPSLNKDVVTRDVMIDDHAVPEATRYLPVSRYNLDSSDAFNSVIRRFNSVVDSINKSESPNDDDLDMAYELSHVCQCLNDFYAYAPPPERLIPDMTMNFSPYPDPDRPTHFVQLFGLGDISWDESESRSIMVSILEALDIETLSSETHFLAEMLDHHYDAFHPTKILSLTYAQIHVLATRAKLPQLFKILVYCYFQGCCVAWFGQIVHPGLFNAELAQKFSLHLPSDYVIVDPKTFFSNDHPIWSVMSEFGRKYGIPEQGRKAVYFNRQSLSKTPKNPNIPQTTKTALDSSGLGTTARDADASELLTRSLDRIRDQLLAELDAIKIHLSLTDKSHHETASDPAEDHPDVKQETQDTKSPFVRLPHRPGDAPDEMSVYHDRFGLVTNIKKDPSNPVKQVDIGRRSSGQRRGSDSSPSLISEIGRKPSPIPSHDRPRDFRLDGGPQHTPITPDIPAFKSVTKRELLPRDRVPENWANNQAQRDRRDTAERIVTKQLEMMKAAYPSTDHTYDTAPTYFSRAEYNPPSDRHHTHHRHATTVTAGPGGGHPGGDDDDDDDGDDGPPGRSYRPTSDRPPWPYRRSSGDGGGDPPDRGGGRPPYHGTLGGRGRGSGRGRGGDRPPHRGSASSGSYGHGGHGGGGSGGDPSGGHPYASPRYDPIGQFRRGQKRDASVFIKLKTDSQFYTWKRHAVANFIAQDCGDILNYDYVPLPHTIEGQVDRMKNDYVFAVLTGTLDTPKGRSLLMAYEDTRDARAVWCGLVEYYTKSTFAVVLSQQIMQWLTTMRLGTGRWTKTTHEFVLEFEEKVDLYNNMQRNKSGWIIDEQAMSMLQTAVSQHRDLAQVQQQLETSHITTGVQATYQMYRQLLLSACVKVDRTRVSRSNLSANATEFFPGTIMDDDTSAASPSADPPDEVTDYETHQVRMNKQTWQKIPSEDQKIWDTMSQEGKQVVLSFAAQGPPPKGRRRTDRSRARDRSRSVSFADQDPSVPDTETDPVDSSPSATEADADDDTRIISNIIASHHPASLPRVLSSDSNTPTDRSSTTGKREITMSERYVVSNQKRSHSGALIDRGANGGMAGSDTRTINHTGDYCDLSGIDNHEMPHVPLVTAGAVVRSHNGPIILLMHNYAKVPGHKTIHSAHQLADNGVTVDDRHHLEGGSHCITTVEGYKIPLSFRNGLPYMDMRKYTDAEYDTLPHVHLTSIARWHPGQHDFEITDEWFQGHPPTPVSDPPHLEPHGRSPFTAVHMVDLLQDTTFRDEFVSHDIPSSAVVTAYSVLSSPVEGECLSSGSAHVPMRDTPDGESNGESAAMADPGLTPVDSDSSTDDGESHLDGESPHITVAQLEDAADLDVSTMDISDAYISSTHLRKKVRRFISDSAFGRLPNTCMLRTMNRAFWLAAARIIKNTTLSEEQQCAALRDLHERKCNAHTPGELLGGEPFDACRYGSTFSYRQKKRGRIKARGVHVSTRSTSRAKKANEPEARLSASTKEKGIPPEITSTPEVVTNQEPATDPIDDVNEEPDHEEKYSMDQADLISRLSPLFFGASPLVTARTLKATTQFGTRRGLRGLQLRNTYRAPNPALNIQRRQEPVATDTIVADTPAVDCGHTYCQIFLGVRSKVLAAHGCSTDGEFVRTLLDEIRKRGAPDMLISDNAKAEVSERAKDVLRQYAIDDWQSEAYFQHQNPVERRWGTAKACVSRLMNISGADANAWLLAVEHVFMVLNCMALKSLGYRTPNEILTGVTPDISAFMEFHFWEPVYYKKSHDKWEKFPSQSDEAMGRWVGVSENVGHAMTYKILTEDTKKVICRSVIRSADPDWAKNRRIDPKKKETVFFDRQKGRPFPTFNPADLYGRTFMTMPDDQGNQRRAEVIGSSKLLDSDKMAPGDHPAELVKWRYRVGDDVFEEVMAYSRMLEFVNADEHEPDLHRLDSIVDHRKRNGTWEVKIRWENGSYSWNALRDLAMDDEVSCAVYARAKGLLDQPGWKRFKTIGSKANMKKLYRMIHRTKLKSYRAQPIYKFGELVPRNFREARRYDEMNGDQGWSEAEKLELSQLIEYKAYYSLGLNAPVPEGHTLILVHFVYDRKICGKKKARLVANGNMTDTPIESTYSGVVSLRGLRIMFFLAELNGLQLWATDVGNAYLESLTGEQIVFRAGPEFGEKEGHLMKVYKALYGLKSSSARWHERCADILRDMGFVSSKADPDIWMRDKGDHYEYIGVYVDDLAIASREPQKIIDCLLNDHKLKLKGTGPLTYHLGCDYFRDKTGVLCGSPRTYVEKLIGAYERMFGEKPRMTYASPIEKGDHPELDTSPLLDDKGIMKFQSMLGALQWVVSIGRMDVATAVMSMGSFRVAPREGHLQRLRRIYGYLARMKHGTIRYRTDQPDYSQIEVQDFDWKQSVYGNVREMIPKDAPRALGKPVTQTTYVDANLLHNLATGHSVTGVLHLLNQTPADYYTKKQATVETSTYGSEFVAARTAVQQIQDIRLMLRYLGAPIKGCAYLFGDNEAVVKSGSIPYSRLSKRHIALSYHYVREVIASGMVAFVHIPGDQNPADILSKHWGYSAVWPMLKPLLFYEGDTAKILLETKPVQKTGKKKVKETTPNAE